MRNWLDYAKAFQYMTSCVGPMKMDDGCLTIVYDNDQMRNPEEWISVYAQLDGYCMPEMSRHTRIGPDEEENVKTGVHKLLVKNIIEYNKRRLDPEEDETGCEIDVNHPSVKWLFD